MKGSKASVLRAISTGESHANTLLTAIVSFEVEIQVDVRQERDSSLRADNNHRGRSIETLI